MSQKRWILIGLVIFSLVTASQCTALYSHRTMPSSYALDLQHSFEHSKVEVRVNGRLHYKGVVTSDGSMGLAKSLPDTGPCTQVTVKVRCDDGSTATENCYPAPSRGFFIGVNFNPFFKKVSIEQYSEAPRYY